MRRRPGPLWGVVAFIAIAGAMLSLPPPNLASLNLPNCSNDTICVERGIPSFNCSDGRTLLENATNCSDTCANASDGTECATSNLNLCAHVLCTNGSCTDFESFVPPSCNDNNPCTVDTCDPCANDCAGACNNTPSNSSECNLTPGDPCFANGQCTTDICVDGVCCDRACNAPLQSCNAPGNRGTCVAQAPAPVVSPRGVA